MHRFASYNGRVLPIEQISLPALSSAALYGAGVFTTLAVHNQKPFLPDKHLVRLRTHAAKFGIKVDALNLDETLAALLEIITANQVARGRARVTLFDLRASRLWCYDAEQETATLIQTTEAHTIAPNNFRLTFSPFRVNTSSPLTGIKSCNYLENLLAHREAGERGFDEAIRLNERGETVSATLANIFWTKDNQLFTPALTTGALAGTTRETVIELAHANGLSCAEVSASPDELRTADAMFLTSAGLGIKRVTSLDDKVFPKLENDSATRLQKAFAELIARQP